MIPFSSNSTGAAKTVYTFADYKIGGARDIQPQK